MKLLLISDEEDCLLWDYYRPGSLRGTDLILSAGDLRADYLSFLVTVANCPLLYVHGNHDGSYDTHPPEGCDSIDGRLVKVKGLRILGLGGSVRYSEGPYQYTERQMRNRIRRLELSLRRMGGVDIVLTHSPPFDCGDEDSLSHRGFEAFLPLLDRWQPRYLIHGHVHMRYQASRNRILRYGSTTVINASGKYWLEADP